jgi:hypothetical protein
MRTLALALLLVAAPALAQQPADPNDSMTMDGTVPRAVGDTGRPLRLSVLDEFPEEHLGPGYVERVAITSTHRLTREGRSLYEMELADANGTMTARMPYKGIHVITTDERIGRALIAHPEIQTAPIARVYFRVSAWSHFEFWPEARNSTRTPYAAEVYRIEWLGDNGEVQSAVPRSY